MTVATPSLEELVAAAVPFRVPLRTRFRGVTYREGILFRGPRGAGEFAPFDDYDAVAAARWLAAAVDAAWAQPPLAVRDCVAVNAIIPDVDLDTTRELARAAALAGCDTMKIKVATAAADAAEKSITSERDLLRVAAVRTVLNEVFGAGHGRIRIDANAAWQVEDAIHVLPLLHDAAGGLEYVEQPCVELADCAQVRAATSVPIAIDEGLRRADVFDEQTLAAIRDAADVVIVKPIPLGGAAATLRIVEQVGRPVVVSGSMDTSVGLSYVLATACALPSVELACGLGTGSLLAGDLTKSTLLPVAGQMHRTVVELDDEALRNHSIAQSDPRWSWWMRRLHEVAAHVPAIGSVTP